MRNRLFILPLCFVLILCCACGNSVDQSEVIAVEAGGVAFTRKQVLMSIANYCAGYQITLEDIRNDEQIWERMKTDFTNMLAIECLASQNAEKLGVTVTDDLLAQFEDEYGAFLDKLDETNKLEALTDSSRKSKSFEESKLELRDRYFDAMGYTAESHKLQQQRSYVTKFVKAKVTEEIAVTEQEILNYYDMNSSSQEKSFQLRGIDPENPFAETTVLYYPNGYKYVKNILLPFPASVVLSAAKLYSERDPALDAMLERETSLLQDSIDDIRRRLESGESFDVLAAEYPGDEGMQQEPQKSRGYFVSTQYNDLIDAYKEAVDSLKNVGDVAECVTYRGYYFCYANEIVDQGPAPYDEVRSAIEQVLLTNNKAIAWDQITRGWIEDGMADGSVMIDTTVLD